MVIKPNIVGSFGVINIFSYANNSFYLACILYYDGVSSNKENGFSA